jgi:hypothetical protein
MRPQNLFVDTEIFIDVYYPSKTKNVPGNEAKYTRHSSHCQPFSHFLLKKPLSHRLKQRVLKGVTDWDVITGIDRAFGRNYNR